MTICSPAALLIDAQGNALAGGDAFGRLRVSEPHTLFDSKQLYDGQPLLFAEKVTGGATIAHQAPDPSSLLSVTALAGDSAIRQTKRYFNYQPGKSHLIFATFAGMFSQTGCTKRVGYFDANDGVFLEVLPAAVRFVKRSSVDGPPDDTAVAQASWNIDTLDGAGPSGVALDLTKSQILLIDMEWLGVGSVRMGFVVNGCVIWCHAFHNANINAGVYMATPNLPVRWEVSTDGTGAGSLSAICCSVMSEGGQEDTGARRSADRGIVGRSIANSGLRPLISIRLKSGRRDTVLPEALQLMASTGGNLLWALCLNPTFGGAGHSWVSVPDSPIEYDVTEAVDLTAPGWVLKSGYMSANMDQIPAKLNGLLAIAADVDGVSDIWTLAAQNVAGGTETVFGSLGWLELG